MNILRFLLVLLVLDMAFGGPAVASISEQNNGTHQQARYSELGDLLTVEQAQGRFAWLSKCFDGLLVELWEQMYESTDIVQKEEKLRQLKELWLSGAALAAGKAQYVTFANTDFTNPYQWYAGTSADEACSIMPPEYKPVALKTTVLPRSYCDNRSYVHEWEWISEVTVDDVTHRSEKHGYSQISGKVFGLRANQVSKVTIKPGHEEPEFPSYVAARVWLDWDHNGQFEPSEMVYRSASTGVFEFSLDVPAQVPEGLTLMRVAIDAGGGSDNACTRVHYGEVEDYLVTIR
ncbi:MULTISPECIES: GEVED domain-containing protein [unclassified Pseudoalteromonas]|uniref:GEVED domain-containing protein n=1 Tax=unclassified Pseudoalteromonas TaxID=194690 RepID=UPI0020979560|nr:GEVED domain-containing protein [Pseudoalteromonas sp. XMcav2-N]MCO7190623.1 GEVED domain-containing protein [Pseudoalteromonas sp. XMcav2-N]